LLIISRCGAHIVVPPVRTTTCSGALRSPTMVVDRRITTSDVQVVAT
jgi:hypothetical protein